MAGIYFFLVKVLVRVYTMRPRERAVRVRNVAVVPVTRFIIITDRRVGLKDSSVNQQNPCVESDQRRWINDQSVDKSSTTPRIVKCRNFRREKKCGRHFASDVSCFCVATIC
ncbi:uncharacterized protein LOC112685439 [Sipha flava]|uniref:Uncharacterized protein LOC112685439 n=1 Tax=Sipha flava TaxID=143950 RepID=A0A8B8FRY0_9HEMI|nr:uncharacterized protein LOC112685439 [Sipha flava]